MNVENMRKRWVSDYVEEIRDAVEYCAVVDKTDKIEQVIDKIYEDGYADGYAEGIEECDCEDRGMNISELKMDLD